MTLQQLEYIVALDTHRSFVRAAESCFVTQPTLTMQVKKLEDEWSILLFDRTKKPVEPTAFGERVVLKARQVLREFHQLEEIIKEDKETMKGEFRVGVIPTLAPYVMPRFLKLFTERHSDIRLIVEEIQTVEIIHRLKNDLLDIGILVTPLEESEIREIPLFLESFFIYTSEIHPLFGAKEVDPEHIPEEDLWILNEGHCFRSQVLNICRPKSEQIDQHGFVYESGSIETLKELVDQNGGFTLIPELSARQGAKTGQIIPFKEPQPVREVSFVVHQGFTKEHMLAALRDDFLESLPSSVEKKKSYIRVNWK